MKINKFFLLAVLSTFTTSLLMGCNANNTSPENDSSEEEEEWEEIVYEIGDTVKEWHSNYDLEHSPLALADSTKGTVELSSEFGNEDLSSIECNITGDYVTSEVLEEPYFTDDDAKNGDIISLYFYLPAEHNVKSLQLEALTPGPVS